MPVHVQNVYVQRHFSWFESVNCVLDIKVVPCEPTSPPGSKCLSWGNGYFSRNFGKDFHGLSVVSSITEEILIYWIGIFGYEPIVLSSNYIILSIINYSPSVSTDKAPFTMRVFSVNEYLFFFQNSTIQGKSLKSIKGTDGSVKISIIYLTVFPFSSEISGVWANTDDF